ncbi:MAG: DNA repair protein [Gammaproteobacteria bacterium BRH_c0]|nr:MAG: DNA repair protein [Gammaproteobacteria bacterium BRH_c0]
MESQLTASEVFSNPTTVKQYCQLQISLERDEHFCCLFLNTRHSLISFERLFRGTVDGASVYPRVVVRRCLELNASAVIFTHNHPSGIAEPSRDDATITRRLKDALALIDVRVLDHIVVGTGGTTSMAEQGLL